MSTLTKLALGMMGKLRPEPAIGDAAPRIALLAPQKDDGMPLMEALANTHTLQLDGSVERVGYVKWRCWEGTAEDK